MSKQDLYDDRSITFYFVGGVDFLTIYMTSNPQNIPLLITPSIATDFPEK